MSDNKINAAHNPPGEHELAGTPEVATGSQKRRAGKAPSAVAVLQYDTVETAAAKLGIAPTALRARLRRAQRVEGNAIVADLGGGIRGFKFGSSWRIRFPEA